MTGFSVQSTLKYYSPHTRSAPARLTKMFEPSNLPVTKCPFGKHYRFRWCTVNQCQHYKPYVNLKLMQEFQSLWISFEVIEMFLQSCSRIYDR